MTGPSLSSLQVVTIFVMGCIRSMLPSPGKGMHACYTHPRSTIWTRLLIS